MRRWGLIQWCCPVPIVKKQAKAAVRAGEKILSGALHVSGLPRYLPTRLSDSIGRDKIARLASRLG